MMKTLLAAIALAFLTTITLHGGAMAQDDDPEIGYGVNIDAGDDDDGPEYSVDEGPDCDWIAKQVRNVGSAHWKVLYFNECVSTVDPD